MTTRSGDHAEAAAALRGALRLWGDPSPAGVPLTAPHAQRLAELRAGATGSLAQALARCGDHTAAAGLLESVVEAHPDWEHSHAQLIDCYLALGDIDGARRVFDSARRYLAGQGVEPGAALQEAAGRVTGAARAAAASGQDAARIRALPGRAAELQRLVQLARSALGGRVTSGVVISGEPGIGKSALAEAALQELAAGAASPDVVTVRCDSRQSLPYGPLSVLADLAVDLPGEHGSLASMLQAAPPDDGPADAGAGSALADREHVAAAFRGLVRAACSRRGLVILAEDIQWAPADTVGVLCELVGGDQNLPLVIIATTRESAAASDLQRAGAMRLALRGLGRDAVAELTGMPPHDDRVDRVLQLTGGNPLYIKQLGPVAARDHCALPDDLQAAISARLDTVPADVRESLGLAAVLGDQVDVDVLAAIDRPLRLPRPVWMDRLVAAEAHGVVRRSTDQPDGFTFVHALVRDQLYRSLPAWFRTQAHVEIGRAMDRLARGGRRRADLIAHHFTMGWPETTTREVVDSLHAAAEAAIVQLDFRQAAEHFRRALKYLAMDPAAAGPAEIVQTLGDAGRCASAAGEVASAAALYREQADLADRAGIPLAVLAATLGLLQVRHNDHPSTAMVDDLAAALAAAARQRALHQRPDLAAEALAAVHLHRPRHAEELLQRICSAEPDLAGRLHSVLWEHRGVSAQLATARRLVADSAAEPVGAWLRLWVSEVAAGLRALDDPPARSFPVGMADDRTQFDVTLWRITVCMATGRFDRATHLIDRALAAPRHREASETARRMAALGGQRAFVTVTTEGPGGAHGFSQDIGSAIGTVRHPIMRYVAAFLTARRGERRLAVEQCDDLLDELRDASVPDSDLLVRLTLLADACIQSQHAAGMGMCAGQLLGHRGHHAVFHFTQYWGAVDRTLGNLQVALGEVDAGIEMLGQALQQHQRAHALLYEWYTHRDIAAALARRDRPADRPDAAQHRLQAGRLARFMNLRAPREATGGPTQAGSRSARPGPGSRGEASPPVTARSPSG